jgi:hypothetical protein
MSTPFSLAQFLDVFRRYNDAVSPAQEILVCLAIVAMVSVSRARRGGSKVASAVLAALWIWTGVVYHYVFFRPINPAATLFAIAFVLQGALIAWLGVVRTSLRFEARVGWPRAIGGATMLYALVGYPLIGIALGHTYPAAPTFGVPCPTTIFTLGMLVWAIPPRSRAVVVIPTLWSVVALFAGNPVWNVGGFRAGGRGRRCARGHTAKALARLRLVRSSAITSTRHSTTERVRNTQMTATVSLRSDIHAGTADSSAGPAIKTFAQLRRTDVATVGGKGANLGELTAAGLPVPPGFVLGIDAYDAFCRSNELGPRITAELARTNPDDPTALERSASVLRGLVLEGSLPASLQSRIEAAYDALVKDETTSRRVAVRSSATAEDTAQFSFAGMFESVLNVLGKPALIEAVKTCWASTFSARVLFIG